MKQRILRPLAVFAFLLAAAATTACGDDVATGDDDFTADIGKSEKLLAEAEAKAERHAAGKSCDEDIFRGDIVELVRQAIAARDTVFFRTKVVAKKPNIAKVLAGSLEWQELIGTYDPKKPETLAKGLAAGVSIWDTDGGIFGNKQRIEFKADGKAVIHTRDTESEDFHFNAAPTTYRFENGTVKLGNGTTLKLEFIDGRTFASKPGEGRPAFESLQSECEA